MKSDRVWLIISLLALTVFLAALPALADTPTRAEKTTQFEPGNYCVSCHTPGDARLVTVADWHGSISYEQVNGCAAASQVREDLYYTERLLLAIERARSDVPAWAVSDKSNARLAAARETYSRMLDTPVNSLDAVTSEGSVLRYQLGKIYNGLNQARTTVKRQIVLMDALIVTAILLTALGWGWHNINRFGSKGGARRWGGIKAILFIIMIFILFALPIFRIPSQEVESATEEEQARQTTLDIADRAADANNRALARSSMLGRVGAAWRDTNAQQANEALAEALAGAVNIEQDTPALWGEIHAAYEGTVGSAIDQEKAGLVADKLNATNGRGWNLGLIANELAGLEPAQAEAILEAGLELVAGQTGFYRNLDMRGLAVTWAAINPEKAQAVANRIYDPAIRAWALREIADLSSDPSSLYDQAAKAAREIAEPVDRARALREVAVRSGNKNLFTEALAILETVDGVELAYALADLAAASADSSIAARVDPAYPDAQALALYSVQAYDRAWAAAANIADPFDRARAQSAIAGAWRNVDAANEIADPTLRDRALRDIAIIKEDASLAGSIESPYYRVQALTELGQHEAALEAAQGLSDAYPLVALAVTWTKNNPQAALTVVDMLDREADKAEAMRAIAVATGAESDFERALNLALAARVRGAELAPAEASLKLGQAFNPKDVAKADSAFNQAYEIAAQISTRYK